MARFLVEILINAAGGPKARAAFDDVGAAGGASGKRVEEGMLRAERATRRMQEAAERLQNQMEETKASKGLIADLSAMNRRTQEMIAVVKEGAAGLERFEQKEKEAALAARVLSAQIKAGVSPLSLQGKEINDLIRQHDRLQAELHQTARAQAGAAGAGGGGIDAGGVSRISVLASSARSLLGTAAAVTASVAGLGYSIKHLTDAAAESEGVLAQLEAGITSTGGVAGQTVSSLTDLASSLSRLSGLDDEVVAGGEAILLTFTKVAGDVFPAATAAALDMSVRMKQDLNSSILLVGKALNDPIKGVTALSRSGVQFSESQKEMIKSLVEAGDLLGAQTIILRELETQFGGSAAAARDTLGGALTAAQTETGNLIEIIADGLSPTIRDLAEDYIAWAQSAEGQREIAEIGELVADSLHGILSAAEILTPAFKILALEAKLLLGILNGFLEVVGFVADRVTLARDAYVGWARGAGILRTTISDSTPIIQQSLTTQLDAVFALRKEYGELGQAALEAARDQMTAMEAEAAAALTLAQKNRELLRTREETRKRNAEIGAQKDTGPTAADAELLRQTIELEKHGANLNNIITRQTLRLNEHSEAAKKAAAGTGDLSESQEDAQEAARRLFQDLVDAERGQRDLTDAAKDSTSAYKAETLAQEQAAQAAKIREAYLKAGLTWTDKNTAAVYSLVKSLRELKTQESAILQSRALMLEVEVDTSSLDAAIDAANKRAIEIDLEWRRSAFTINQQNQQAFADQRTSVQTQLQEQADYLKSTLITPKQELDALMRHIDALADAADDAGRPLLSAAEAERLRAAATADFIAQSADAWSGFFSYLGSAFGGVFSQISSMIQGIQSGYQTGSQLGGMSSMGSAAGGGAGAFVAVVVEVYKWMKADAAKKKAESYSYGASIVKGDNANWNINVSDQARQASLQIKSALEELVDMLGGTIESFASLEIQVRRDGKYFHAFVAGQFVGWFTDMQSAMNAAMLAALKNPATTFSGLSSLITEGLEYALSDGVVKIGSMEELTDFLGQLRSIEELTLDPAAVGLQKVMAEFNRMREALDKLDQSSQTVIDAQRELTEAQLRAVEQTKNALLGIDTSAADAVRALGGLSEGMADVADSFTRGIQNSIAAAEKQLAALENPAPNVNADGGGRGDDGGGGTDLVARTLSGTVSDIDSEKARLKKAIEDWEKQLEGVPKALTDQEIDLGVYTSLKQELERSGKHAGLIAEMEKEITKRKYEQLRLELIAIGAWERWAGVWTDLYAQAMQDAGRPPAAGRGGSGGGSDRKGQREDLLAEIARIRAELSGPLTASFFDFQERLKDFRERAKEAKLSAADVAAGIAAMTEEFKRSVKEQAEAWAGRGTDFTKRLADMKKFFEELRKIPKKDSGLGPGKIRELEGEALGQFGTELTNAIAAFGGMLDPMVEINGQAGVLRQNLLAYAEAAGWSGEQIAAAQAAIDAGVEYQRQQGINGLMDRLFAWMKQAGIESEKALEHERAKALLDLQIIEAQLRFYGALTTEAQGWIDGVRDWVNSDDFGLTDAANDLSQAARDLSESSNYSMDLAKFWRNAVQEWRGAVKDEIASIQSLYTNDNLTNLTQDQQLTAAQTRYRELLARAQAGDVEALRDLAAAREEYLQEARDSEAGGAGYDAIWREVMEGSAEFLAGAQEAEAGVIERAIQEFMDGAGDNTETITLAIYESADQVAAAIWASLGMLPGYATGGIVGQRGRELAWVGENGMEAIVPMRQMERLIAGGGTEGGREGMGWGAGWQWAGVANQNQIQAQGGYGSRPGSGFGWNGSLPGSTDKMSRGVGAARRENAGTRRVMGEMNRLLREAGRSHRSLAQEVKRGRMKFVDRRVR